jgi:ribonuclease PH
MNVVMTSTGEFIELQGTAEEGTFSQADLSAMLALAQHGLQRIFAVQQAAVALAAAPRS